MRIRRHALSRLTNCVLQAGIDQPYAAIRYNLAETMQWLVHVRRDGGRRVVRECRRVVGYAAERDVFELEDLMVRGQGGEEKSGIMPIL